MAAGKIQIFQFFVLKKNNYISYLILITSLNNEKKKKKHINNQKIWMAPLSTLAIQKWQCSPFLQC